MEVVNSVQSSLDIQCRLLDIGGGYPGLDGSEGEYGRFIGKNASCPEDKTKSDDETTAEIASVVTPLLDELFPEGDNQVNAISEPGRYFVQAAFALCSRIYSVRVETYLPALACLVLATELAAERPVRFWLLVPSVVLAILYHQTNVLFVLPLMVLLCHGCRGQDLYGAWRRTAAILILSAALSAGVYLVGFKYDSPPGGFWDFVLSYARAPIEAWGSFGYFSPAGIQALATSQARMILPVPEQAAFLGGPVMLSVLVFLAVWHIIRLRRRAAHGSLRLFSLVLLATYLPFFLWWMPGDVDFFLATLLPVWLLVLILIDDLPASVRSARLAAVVVLLLAAGNLVFTIWPMHRDPGPGRALALALDRAAPSEADFVTGYAVQQEMLYFTGRTRVHEGEGLSRAVLKGEKPWNTDRGPVVVDGLFLRSLLQRPDPEAEMFLRWLTGFDAGEDSCWTFRNFPRADGLQVGPPRRTAVSWPSVEAELKGLVQP